MADFGVSEQLLNMDVPVKATDFVGSPLFMAPEVILKQGYNQKADTWSLGISLIGKTLQKRNNTKERNKERKRKKYNNLLTLKQFLKTEMAEGRPPNTDITNMTALLQLPSRPSPKLKNQKQWSPSMNDFVAKCLVKEPLQRAAALDMLTHPFVADAKGADALKGILKEALSLKRGQIPV